MGWEGCAQLVLAYSLQFWRLQVKMWEPVGQGSDEGFTSRLHTEVSCQGQVWRPEDRSLFPSKVREWELTSSSSKVVVLLPQIKVHLVVDLRVLLCQGCCQQV